MSHDSAFAVARRAQKETARVWPAPSLIICFGWVRRSRARRDDGADRLEDLGEHVGRAQVLAALGHFGEELFHRVARAVAPVAAEDEVDADDVVAVVACAHLVAVRAGDDVDSGLKPAVFAEGNGNRRLEVDRTSAAFIEQATERRLPYRLSAMISSWFPLNSRSNPNRMSM